jgi:hypothetical protein
MNAKPACRGSPSRSSKCRTICLSVRKPETQTTAQRGRTVFSAKRGSISFHRVFRVVFTTIKLRNQVGAKLAIEALGKRFKRLKVIFAGAAYKRSGLPDGAMRMFGWMLQPVLRPVDVKGFVKRTFAGINKYRRNAKEDERNTESSKPRIYIAMTNRRLKRLEKHKIAGYRCDNPF